VKSAASTASTIRRAARALDEGKRQPADGEDLVGTQRGIDGACPVIRIDDVVEASPLFVPEPFSKAREPSLESAPQRVRAEGAAGRERVEPERLDLDGLPTRGVTGRPSTRASIHVSADPELPAASRPSASRWIRGASPGAALQDRSTAASSRPGPADPGGSRRSRRRAPGVALPARYSWTATTNQSAASTDWNSAARPVRETVGQHPPGKVARPFEQDLARVLPAAAGQAQTSQWR
jgi:hypothetical protein